MFISRRERERWGLAKRTTTWTSSGVKRPRLRRDKGRRKQRDRERERVCVFCVFVFG